MGFSDIASLDDLKKNKWIYEYIIWGIEPKQIMEPRLKKTEDGIEEINIISGYLFYIDRMVAGKPTLFLMCHTPSGYAETIVRIDEIPDEMIAEAIEENKDKEYFGMCPINKKIERWLRNELGL